MWGSEDESPPPLKAEAASWGRTPYLDCDCVTQPSRAPTHSDAISLVATLLLAETAQFVEQAPRPDHKAEARSSHGTPAVRGESAQRRAVQRSHGGHRAGSRHWSERARQHLFGLHLKWHGFLFWDALTCDIIKIINTSSCMFFSFNLLARTNAFCDS